MGADYILPIFILAGLGFFFGIVLAVANRRFQVLEDPRISVVEELLPSANCGACGEPGCRAFAERVVKEGRNPAKCTVSTKEGLDRIADYLGVEVAHEEKWVARLLCAGGIAEAHNLAHYAGSMKTCRGESVVVGGIKDCTWGCLGLADCARACSFGAITMNDDGLPLVDTDKCTACNDCVEVCPKGLFELMPISRRLIVQCKSLLEGDLAESKCSVACTACARCVVDSAPGVIEMKNNLATVNYKLNDLTSQTATKRCPTGAIVWLEGLNQFEPVVRLDLPLGGIEDLIGKEYYQ